MKIATITLNPAFDIHCVVDDLQLYRENYVTSSVKYAGGKGVNISRALTGFGIENTAYCVVGTANGEDFLRLLSPEVCCHPIVTEGKIRENITLHSGGTETRISFEGFSVGRDILKTIFDMLEQESSGDLLVTFTGRLPQGLTKEDALTFLKGIKALGAKLIVDCNSFTKEELISLSPFFIKPNQQEISQLLGQEIQTEPEALKAAQRLHQAGIENVIVSLGADGVVFWNQNGGASVRVPTISPVSTIGAGDSLIAGFIAGLSMGQDICATLKLAAAFGTAACLVEGTGVPQKRDILKLEKDIIINTVSGIV